MSGPVKLRFVIVAVSVRQGPSYRAACARLPNP